MTLEYIDTVNETTPLDVECGYCHARPGKHCVVKINSCVGRPPGTPTFAIHKTRRNEWNAVMLALHKTGSR